MARARTRASKLLAGDLVPTRGAKKVATFVAKGDVVTVNFVP